METEITIDGLIDEGRNIKSAMRRNQGEFAFGYHHADNSRFAAWLQTARRYISCNYSNDRIVDDFQSEIDKYEKSSYTYPDDLDGLIGALISCKSIPQTVDRHINGESIKTQINNNISTSQYQEQTQSQKQSVEIFLEAIKDDLTGKQIKELKQIVADENNDLEKAKPKLGEKIGSFGINVASSIIGNILTNPVIWGGL